MQAALELRILARAGPARLAKLKVQHAANAIPFRPRRPRAVAALQLVGTRVELVTAYALRSFLITNATLQCSCQLARECPNVA
jgi:hypothetical protein